VAGSIVDIGCPVRGSIPDGDAGGTGEIVDGLADGTSLRGSCESDGVVPAFGFPLPSPPALMPLGPLVASDVPVPPEPPPRANAGPAASVVAAITMSVRCNLCMANLL